MRCGKIPGIRHSPCLSVSSVQFSSVPPCLLATEILKVQNLAHQTQIDIQATLVNIVPGQKLLSPGDGVELPFSPGTLLPAAPPKILRPAPKPVAALLGRADLTDIVVCSPPSKH